ncbi:MULTISPECIES: N-acetyltransferase family protein [unclassified Sphingomonas]|uniref:GNAT family N-acetyltransferase n=1 Tax=unclassified Sphingomonas TaxID=196159 RepID=UPI002855497D|nr:MULTISPECIES: N-acetyltransferase family protein [unclassified Sphingomonas]MDR6114910.1 L-amino acid N-acyltransferase YncA [Sphingomonas sp. SORGH_AS_0789]MDR6151417.1 L-amino acid N-acyltransferase YncA [Sphingomonas sp. SORGH_AS_0742]
MIAIRAARPDDAAAIAAIYAPHVLAGVVSFETQAPDADAMRARMAGADGLYPWIVATLSDEAGREDAVIGYAYAARFREREAYRWVVETTIYVADVSQRAGVGRLLYEALVDTLTAQGFTQAMGVIALPNDGSIKLHEAVGFRRAGVFREVGHKHGRWIDVGYWQRELAQPVPQPAEPRRFADVGVVRDPVAVKHR